MLGCESVCDSSCVEYISCTAGTSTCFQQPKALLASSSTVLSNKTKRENEPLVVSTLIPGPENQATMAPAKFNNSPPRTTASPPKPHRKTLLPPKSPPAEYDNSAPRIPSPPKPRRHTPWPTKTSPKTPSPPPQQNHSARQRSLYISSTPGILVWRDDDAGYKEREEGNEGYFGNKEKIVVLSQLQR